jgi:hypothetical protein
MCYQDPVYRKKLIAAIEDYQYEELLSDREVSLKAWMSPTIISKIKKWTTIPKLSTLRKLKSIGVHIPRPEKIVEVSEHTSNNDEIEHWVSA